MRSIPFVVVAVAGIAGCEKKQPRFEGPMPVTFGDCGGASLTWVSGPKPLPFTDEEAQRVKTAANTPPEPAKPVAANDDPPPPASDDDAPQTDDARKHALELAREGYVGGAFMALTGTGDISSGFDDANIYGGLLGNEAGEMNGGFGYGRAGFGPGGGGTGWGTIGTGRYGTIGHGSGTGSGYGVGGGRGGMRGRRSSVPTLSIGQPNVQGDLDKAIIRRYIKRNIQKIQYCYEKQLLAKPAIQGTVATQFVISPLGTVSKASASGVDPEVSSCVQRVISTIEFPKPKGGGSVQVNYPFTFRHADDAVPGAGSATPPAQDPPPVAAANDKPTANAKPAVVPYKPGQHNPLSVEASALEECFRKNAKPYGAVVIQLDYNASGGGHRSDPVRSRQ